MRNPEHLRIQAWLGLLADWLTCIHHSVLLLRKGCVTHPVIKLNRFITGKLQKGHSAPKQTACDGQQVMVTKPHTAFV